MGNFKPFLLFRISAYCILFHCSPLLSQSLEEFPLKGGKLYSASIEHVTSFTSDKDIEIFTLRLGYGSFLTKNFSFHDLLDISEIKGFYKIDVNLVPEFLKAESFGVGVSFLVRWYAIKLGAVSFFLDASAGILYSFKSFPPKGTKLNFTARPSAGIAVRIKNTQLLFFCPLIDFIFLMVKGTNILKTPHMIGLGIFIGLIHRSK